MSNSYENRNINKRVDPARLLLEDIHELYGLSPEYKTWALKKFEARSLRHYLLKRILALSNALLIGNKPGDIFSGKFLLNRDLQLTKVFGRTKLLNACMPDKRVAKWEVNPSDWPEFYSLLLQHSLRLNDVLRINSGVLLAGGLFASGIAYTNALNAKIFDIAKDEMLVLEYLLNPTNKLLTMFQLNKEFKYPLVDLKKIYIYSL